MERGIILPKPKRTRYIKRRPKTVYLPRICQIVQNQGLQHISASIFACLDIKTLLDCKSVCKIWRKFFENPWFWFKMCVQNNMPEVHQTEWKQLIENFQKSNSEIILSRYLIKTLIGVKPEKHYELEIHGNFQSPLTLACKYGEVNIVKALESMNTLEKSIEVADAEIQVIMKKLYPDIVLHVLTGGETHLPRHVAAENGYLEIVKMKSLAFEDSAYGDHNDANIFHLTTLDYAVSGNHHDIVEHLLKKDFLLDYECCDAYDQTVIHRAARYSDAKLLSMLLSNIDFAYGGIPNSDGSIPNIVAKPSVRNDFQTALSIACELGKLECVKVIIEWLKDWKLSEFSIYNDPDEETFTSLHKAATNGHAEVVKLLISEGADPAFATGDGITAICLAAGNGHFEIVKYLCSVMKYPFLVDFHGNNPIHCALMKGQYYSYHEKKRPLHLSKGHIEIVKFLANIFDQPNMKNNAGESPLFLSLQCDN